MSFGRNGAGLSTSTVVTLRRVVLKFSCIFVSTPNFSDFSSLVDEANFSKISLDPWLRNTSLLMFQMLHYLGAGLHAGLNCMASCKYHLTLLPISLLVIFQMRPLTLLFQFLV